MVVVIIIFEEDDDEDVDDDGEDPFPNAFVAFPPFAFPFRPEEDRVYFKEKNVGEEEAESKALIVEKSSSKSSKESWCCSSFARANVLTRQRLLEGNFCVKSIARTDACRALSRETTTKKLHAKHSHKRYAFSRSLFSLSEWCESRAVLRLSSS